MERLTQSRLWHHLAEEDVFNALQSNHHEGLSTDEVTERLRLFGRNQISVQRTMSPLWGCRLPPFFWLIRSS